MSKKPQKVANPPHDECESRPGFRLIFRSTITVKGKKLLARNYGLKAWKFWVKDESDELKNSDD